MKNYVSISLFVFWAIIVAVMVAGLVFYDQNKNSNLSLASNATTSTTSTLPDNPPAKGFVPKKTRTPVPTVTPTSNPTPTPTPVPVTTPAPASNGVVLTVAEVAKHNTANNCWQIINGNVYNLTSLVNSHSGGSAAILQTCGQDGSVGFNTKYSNGSHSGSARSILQSFLVGPLNQTVSVNQTTAPQTNPAQPVFSGQREGDD